MQSSPTYLLTLQAQDRVGIVAGVSRFLAERDGFIVDSQQYADTETGNFFMRMEFLAAGARFPSDINQIKEEFRATAESLGLEWSLINKDVRLKVMIAVSRGGHCLNDLLYRWSSRDLPIDITAVIGNHDNLRALTEWHGLPFHFLPVGDDNRDAQENQILKLLSETGTDLLVLARYMQVLSNNLTEALRGRCINIHHSFLPAFKGAQPYHHAHERGVKLIGATAHYVTPDLDEGPIIEQAVVPVDHRAAVDDMVRIGRHTEAAVLSRAVRAAAERRIFLNGKKTVNFR